MILTKLLEMWKSAEPPPPPKVLVPPMFNYPLLATRTRFMGSAYDLFFGKVALEALFHDYLEGANRLTTRLIILKLDPSSEFIFTASAPLHRNSEEGMVGNAEFRLECIGDNSEETFDICVSNTEPALQMRSSVLFPKLGVALFWKSNPFFKNETLSTSGVDDGIVGFSLGSGTLLTGATFSSDNLYTAFPPPKTAWFMIDTGYIVAGAQYRPKFGSNERPQPGKLENWSFAISYGYFPNDSQFTPSFNFGLELANNSHFIASFYDHFAVQRRVINPFEKNNQLLITNYFDFGVEFQTRVGDYKNKIRDSTLQCVASWQVNKNVLVKGKLGPLSSSIALAFKSWWKPAFTFNVLAARDFATGGMSFGLGFEVECNRQPRYQMAYSKYDRITPNMEHQAGSEHYDSDLFKYYNDLFKN